MFSDVDPVSIQLSEFGKSDFEWNIYKAEDMNFSLRTKNR